MKFPTTNRLLWLASVSAEVGVLLAFVVVISLLWIELPLMGDWQAEFGALFGLEACAVMFGANVALTLRRERNRGFWGIARCAFYLLVAAVVFPAFQCA